MTQAKDKRIEEELDRPLTNLEHIACELEWLRQDLKNESVPSKLLERVANIETNYLNEARDEDEFRRTRIEELEEGLRWIKIASGYSGAPLDSEAASMYAQALSEVCERAASLLSEQPETGERDTPQAHGDVERVARAMYDARCAGKKNYCDFDDLSTNGYHDTYEVFMADAAAALSAMRPVSVDREKLADIQMDYEGMRDAYQNGYLDGDHAEDLFGLCGTLIAMRPAIDRDILEEIRDTADDIQPPGACPFCGQDPYHRTEFGEPVGVTCCEPMGWLSGNSEDDEELREAVRRLICGQAEQNTALKALLEMIGGGDE